MEIKSVKGNGDIIHLSNEEKVCAGVVKFVNLLPRPDKNHLCVAQTHKGIKVENLVVNTNGGPLGSGQYPNNKYEADVKFQMGTYNQAGDVKFSSVDARIVLIDSLDPWGIPAMKLVSFDLNKTE